MCFVDGTANPHLVLAGILGVGYLGIQSNLELTISDCPGPKTAAQMSEDERRALGIFKRLPLSWEEARKNFASDVQLSKIAKARVALITSATMKHTCGII